MSELDRAAILEAVMPALGALRGELDDPEDAETALGRIVAGGEGILAGLPVAGEAFGRAGVRLRVRAEEGGPVRRGDVVAEVGGPLRSMRAVEPVALAFLRNMSTAATTAFLGREEIDPEADRLTVYAWGRGWRARETAPDASPSGQNGLTFSLEVVA